MLMMWTIASAACAAVPALLALANLGEYKSPPLATDATLPPVSVLIPARNEETGIAACIESVLSSRGVQLEVIVVDDGSTDGTAAIVTSIAAHDARVQLLHSANLPAGWNGKQHACWQAANAAASPLLCFIDADVRLQPDALARMTTLLVRERAALISGFPHEITGTVLEKLLLPLIHFVLLGMLPMHWLRTTTKPGFAAGCGQFLLVDSVAYFASGGHAAIRTTMHDGLLLPRLIRQHGYATRLADMTSLASCRMYRSAGETWNGLAKNATEGLAAPVRIVPITLLLGLGQVMPLPLLWWAWTHTRFIIPFLGPPIRIDMQPVWIAVAALVMSYLPRLINTVRYRQSWLGAMLHPVGVALLLLLQWYALLRRFAGGSANWRGRTYTAN